MTRFIDSVIAYRILRMLVTPFEETDAYRLGIIDANGKELKHMRNLNSANEKDAYTILHRMIFRIKKIMNRVPVENKKLTSYAAALSLVKEHYYTNKEPINLVEQYISRLQNDLTEELQQVQEFDSKMLTFKMFMEEEGAPANNAAATPGVAGFTPETAPVRKKIRVLKRRKVDIL